MEYLYLIRYNKPVLDQFVKKRRKELGLSQIELADRAGLGLRFIRDVEQKKPTLRMDKVNQLLQLFGHELGPIPMDRNKKGSGS
ncbi:MAG: helix-turn-helix transcriptional regulator [Bdellovibrionota bacterium]